MTKPLLRVHVHGLRPSAAPRGRRACVIHAARLPSLYSLSVSPEYVVLFDKIPHDREDTMIQAIQ